MKIAPSFRLADVMDMRSGSRRPLLGICMSFVDTPKGKHLGRSSRTRGRSSGRSNNKGGFETRSVRIHSPTLHHNKSSGGTLGPRWSVYTNATRNIQTALN